MTPVYVLLTDKPWHDALFEKLSNAIPANWIRIRKKDDFTVQAIESIKPDWIFIPHWSYIIPDKIYSSFRCVVFHMTDLPYGRGGSPLQNLILRGHTETKISAIQVAKGIDTGDVYLKRPLSLDGSARQIFERAAIIIGEMIHEIINNNPEPMPQEGAVTLFARRKPHESDIAELSDLKKILDHIRMLDCEGYPNAYIDTRHFRFEFTNASTESDTSITANVRITPK